MDNKLIDAYYANRENFAEDERDLLEDQEFLHFSKILCKDLEYLLNMKFIQFWGHISKIPDIMSFLDEFLMNVRKYNDIYKV